MDLLAFQKYLKRDTSLQPETIANYLWHVRGFLTWLAKAKINAENINKYQKYLSAEKNYAPATINMQVASLNQYLKFKKSKLRLQPVLNDRPQKTHLTKSDINKLLRDLPSAQNLINLRNKLILELAYQSGLSIKQIATLKKSDLDSVKKEIILGHHEYPLAPLVWQTLQDYLAKRNDALPWLLINFDRAGKGANGALSVRSIERVIKKTGQKQGLKTSFQILKNTKNLIVL